MLSSAPILEFGQLGVWKEFLTVVLSLKWCPEHERSGKRKDPTHFKAPAP